MDLDEITKSQSGIRGKEGRGPNLEEQHLMTWGRKLVCQGKRGLKAVVDKGGAIP